MVLSRELALTRRLLRLTWTGNPIGPGAGGSDDPLTIAVSKDIECIAIQNERDCLRTGQRYTPTHHESTTSDASQFLPFLLSAQRSSLVTIYFHQEGRQISGILRCSNAERNTVTLESALEEFRYAGCIECHVVTVELSFRGASLIHIGSQLERRRHMDAYDKSPIANIGRFITLFVEFSSYKGVLKRVDNEGKMLVLSNVLITDDMTAQQEIVDEETFHWDEITDGFEVDDERDPATRLRYMSPEQNQAFSHFETLEPRCRLHGSTVYGISSPESDIDVCVPNLGELERVIRSVSNFQVCSDQLAMRLPRLILRHNNGSELDVVDMSMFEPNKDKAMLRICRVPIFKEYLNHIRDFVKWMQSDGLKPMYGFPNSFNMMLMGVFFLQLNELLPVWPELVDGTEQLDLLGHFDAATAATDLYASFLEFLLNESCHCKMDLALGHWEPKPRYNSHRTWLLWDPCDTRRNNIRKNVFAGCQEERINTLLHYVRATLRG